MAEFASPDEVVQAVEELSDDDRRRLRVIAKLYARDPVWQRSGRDAEDLEQEALLATLEGRRRWRKGTVDLVWHLEGAMRSIRSNWSNKLGVPETWNASALERDNTSPLDSQEAPDQQIEQRLAAEAAIREIRELLADDETALLVIDGWAEEMTGPDLCELLEIGRTEYATIARRIRRTAQRTGFQAAEVGS